MKFNLGSLESFQHNLHVWGRQHQAVRSSGENTGNLPLQSRISVSTHLDNTGMSAERSLVLRLAGIEELRLCFPFSSHSCKTTMTSLGKYVKFKVCVGLGDVSPYSFLSVFAPHEV